jgi:hypothetical protein
MTRTCVVVAGEGCLSRMHRTPRFETYFQNHDKFGFILHVADDEVRLPRSTRVVVKVRFTSYKKAGPKGQWSGSFST